MKNNRRNGLAVMTASLGALLAATVVPSQGQVLIDQYNFSNGTLADSVGSTPLQNNFSGTVNVGSFSFAANQGPTLAVDPSLSGNYSIGLQFSLADINSWRSIVNFSNLALDGGNQYLLNGQPNFYNVTGSGLGTVAANTLVDLLITRDGTTGLYNSYLNGVLQNSFNDSASQYAKGTLVGGSAIFQLFHDDLQTVHEASAGNVDLIRVWNGALTGDQVADAFAPTVVPEASTWFAGAMLAFPLGLHGIRYLRNRRSVS